MYHRVNEPGYDPWELAVTPAHFDEQLARLKRRRTVLPLIEFAERHARGDLPRDAVAITFDDGYACNGLNAAPLLAAHGLPATVFLATSAISADHEYWWDDLERIVVGAPVAAMDIEIEGQRHAFDLGPAGDLHAPNPYAVPPTRRFGRRCACSTRSSAGRCWPISLFATACRRLAGPAIAA